MFIPFINFEKSRLLILGSYFFKIKFFLYVCVNMCECVINLGII